MRAANRHFPLRLVSAPHYYANALSLKDLSRACSKKERAGIVIAFSAPELFKNIT
jgi:hypothetical protein